MKKMDFAPLRGYLLKGAKDQRRIVVGGMELFRGWPVWANKPSQPHTEVVVLTKEQYEQLKEKQSG